VSIGKAVVAFAAGVAVGVVGTTMHRSSPPWCAILALVLVLSGAFLLRAWGGLFVLLGYGLGVLVSVQVLAQTGPGGDVLVPSGDAVSWGWLGWLWVLGSVVMVVVAALAPRRWFADVPAAPVPPGVEPPAWPPLDVPPGERRVSDDPAPADESAPADERP